MFDTGQGRKTDPVDAHSVAVAGLRSPGLRTVAADDATVVLRLLVDRRDELGRSCLVEQPLDGDDPQPVVPGVRPDEPYHWLAVALDLDAQTPSAVTSSPMIRFRTPPSVIPGLS